MHKDIVILGAGVVGSAIAFELTRRGVKDVHVVDVDLTGSLSSSERNAGGVRHLWQQKINSDLSKISIDFFSSIAPEIGFLQKGYLWLFSPEQKERGESIVAHTRERKLSYETLGVSELSRRYPFLDKTENLAFGLFGSQDGILNTNALKEYFRKKASAQGASFHNGLWAHSLVAKSGSLRFSVSPVNSPGSVEQQMGHPEAAISPLSEMWSCEKLIIAAGAWSREILKPYFADPVTFPVRRQISFFKAEDLDLSPYGMIVDTSRGYFNPEGGNVLAGLVLKDEKPGYRFDYDSDFFETHIWPNLFERSSKFERLKHISGWGGLYSYTPDITGILGNVPGLPEVYEAHSFTGHGVMQSYAAGVLLAEKILEGKYTTINAECLSRDRFLKKDPALLLQEDLHI